MSKITVLPKSKFITSSRISLKEFSEKRNTILIIRNTGGLGDILMSRMIFEDFKRAMPEIKIVFACPTSYHDAVKDHPFIDEIVDSHEVDETEYIINYNITTACGDYEHKIAPRSDKHRSDIWAEHCGLLLEHHNMHIAIPIEARQKCREILQENSNGKKNVLFCPISAMKSKDLDAAQMNEVKDGLKERGFNVIGLHNKKINDLEDTQQIQASNFIEFLGYINEADYIVSVDTAALHAAGGCNKPCLGTFSWADGYVYTKYYPKCHVAQKHRLTDPTWTCGPCYIWSRCTKLSHGIRKPCITELTSAYILKEFDVMTSKFSS